MIWEEGGCWGVFPYMQNTNSWEDTRIKGRSSSLLDPSANSNWNAVLTIVYLKSKHPHVPTYIPLQTPGLCSSS